MKILVTGANSLLGSHLVKDLLQENYHVRAMVRDKNKLLITKHANLEIVEADLLDENSLPTAVKEIEVILHTAALTSQSYALYDKYYQVNVIGTKNLLKFALKEKVKKILYISSANTFTEKNVPINSLVKRTYYARSKQQAEAVLLAKASFIKVNIVHPTFMLGKYDVKPSSGQIFKWMYDKKIVFYPPGGKSFVSAKQVSSLTLEVMKNGKNKTPYLIAGTNWSYKTFFEEAIKIQDQDSILIKIPAFLLILIGYLGNIVRKFKINTPISHLHMKILCTNLFYTNENIPEYWRKRHSVPIKKEINRTMQWMVEKDIL